MSICLVCDKHIPDEMEVCEDCQRAAMGSACLDCGAEANEPCHFSCQAWVR